MKKRFQSFIFSKCNLYLYMLEDEKYFEPVLAMIPVAEVRDKVAAGWWGCTS
jgi:hypothetical protein